MLVGGKFGPGVFDIAEIIGKEETISRIKKPLQLLLNLVFVSNPSPEQNLLHPVVLSLICHHCPIEISLLYLVAPARLFLYQQ